MQVFISYGGNDEQLAARLTHELREAGVSVWSPAESVFPGDNWALEIGKALEKCDLLVALFSRGVDDSIVRGQVQFALTSGNYQGRIVPVLMDFVTFKAGVEVPWILLKLNPIYTSRLDPDFASVVKRVQEIADAGFHATA